MEGLTLENFWNHFKESYPEQVDHFSKWIDEYKKEVDWMLFMKPGMKFHHLPFEMQQGILSRYMMELEAGPGYYEDHARKFIHGMVAGMTGAADEEERKCRVCGCTDTNCRQCIEKTGHPCHWVEDDLCSACVPAASSLLLPGRDF